MRQKLNTFYYLLIAILMFGCGKKSDQHKDDDGLKEQAKAYVEAYNSQDVNKLTALFEKDGVYCDFSIKRTFNGRDEIGKYFSAEFKGNKKFKIKLDRLKINNKNKDIIAVVTFTPDSDAKTIYRAIYVKKDGVWSLKRLASVENSPSHSNYDNLKDLSFFIGSWVDQDEDTIMQTTFRWDKNKNFIIQNFSLKILGVQQVKGKQFIGWDPLKKRIHSWIIDSDGGYGTAVWTKKEGSWYVKVIFVTSDGSKVTATDVYTQIDEKTYTFSSINREVDGNVCPNIGPFNVIRKK